MRWWKWLLLVLAGLALLLAFLPLRLVTGTFVPELEADDIDGTIWNAKLRNARYQSFPIGDIDAGLEFRHLFDGRAEVRFVQLQAPFSGRAAIGFNRRAVHALAGTIPVPVLPAPLPPVQLQLEDVGLLIDAEGRCLEAGGQAFARIDGLPAIGTLPLLSGTLRCDGDALLLPLSAEGDGLALDVRVWRQGRWQAAMRIATDNSLAKGVLGLMGFSDGPAGMTSTVEGSAGLG